jgi:hypothetical protein
MKAAITATKAIIAKIRIGKSGSAARRIVELVTKDSPAEWSMCQTSALLKPARGWRWTGEASRRLRFSFGASMSMVPMRMIFRISGLIAIMRATGRE